jgi:hypothetical protein
LLKDIAKAVTIAPDSVRVDRALDQRPDNRW